MFALLEQLSTAAGISGHEGPVRAILQEAVQEHVDRLEVDGLGNLLTWKQPRPTPAEGQPVLRVMLAAHMDEVGFLVTKVNDDGTLKFHNVGGVDPRILPGKRVRIGQEGIPGVVLRTPIHLQKSGQRDRVAPLDELIIDTGGASGIQPGDPIAFEGRYEPVGRLLKGKAFDDRIGCLVLAELLKREYPVELVGAFTVQEEIGLRGARVAAFRTAPDLAFALEGTVADDLPKDEDVSPTTELGQGPAISVMDRSALADRRLVRLLVETAQELGIPHQFKQPGIGGTDIGAIHLVREGIPSVAVAVPCRYIHAPAALLDPRDVEGLVTLMDGVLRRLPQAWETIHS